MKKVKFLDWELNVDYELTKQTYNNIHIKGGSQSCICDDCKNFINNIENVYPDEIKTLFFQLGIDYHKDCEICKMYKDKKLHRYSGWFHFKGNFYGESCITVINKETSELKLKAITENFSIGFCYNNALTLFEDNKDLVQIEFEVKIPWTIDSVESD